MRILLGALRAQTRGLGMRKDRSIVDGAVGKHAHHQSDGAPETTGSGFHCISGDSAFAVGLDEISVNPFGVRSQFPGNLPALGKHFGDGRLRFGGSGGCDGFRSHDIDDSQDRGAHKADRGQHQSHVGKIRFSCHIYFLPNLRWWNFILMSGTAMFMKRMAKDMPSG